MKRPILYLDIDGVLFGRYGRPYCSQMRPHSWSFLSWAMANFDVRWLTSWSWDEVRDMMRICYGNLLAKGDPRSLPRYTEWQQFKSEAIDPTSDWYWVDDAPDFNEGDWIVRHGKDRFVLADPTGADELLDIRTRLTGLLEARGVVVQDPA